MLLLEVQDVPSHAEIYTLRTTKVIENDIKVVRGVCKGSKGISIIGSLHVSYDFCISCKFLPAFFIHSFELNTSRHHHLHPLAGEHSEYPCLERAKGVYQLWTTDKDL